MNRKFILVGLILTIFTSTMFAAEIEVDEFTPSAKSWATAGVFSSDSDNLSAKNIFNIERTFFSAGFIPQLNGAADSATMSGFWAMPIGENMTVGLSAQYEMKSDKVLNRSGASWSFPADHGYENTSVAFTSTELTELTESSSFNLRPVFRFNNMAFSYRISRNGDYKQTDFIGKDSDYEVIFEGKNVTASSADWQHELGFAMDLGSIIFYVPLGVVINNNGSTSYDYTDNTDDTVEKTFTGATTDSRAISMYINPEATLDLEFGPMKTLTAGLNTSFQIYNGGGQESSTLSYSVTTGDIDKVEKTIETDGQADINVEIYATPTLEWSIWEEKIDFVVEPTLGVKYNYQSDGATATSVTTTPADPSDTTEELSLDGTQYSNIITPYLSAAVGTLIRPWEWLELRAGLSYGLNWATTLITTRASEDANAVSVEESTSLEYNLSSDFYAFGGVGFIFGEDFFIDIYVQAGQTADGLLSSGAGVPNTSNIEDSADLTSVYSYGVQLSYRF